MKKYLMIIFIFLLLVNLFSLNRKDKFASNDKILIKIKKELPEKWIIFVEKELIIFERDGWVWSLMKNMINAPLNLESEAERNNRIKRDGQKIRTKIMYRYEGKWSKEKVKAALERNKNLYSEINSLLDKHEVRTLIDEKIGMKENVDYFKCNTDEEKRRVNLYKQERKKLIEKIIKIPDYNTEKYSLFFLKKEGCSDEYHIIYPFKVSEEAYNILTIINEYCEKIE